MSVVTFHDHIVGLSPATGGSTSRAKVVALLERETI